MKSNILLTILGVSASIALPGCVDPYYSAQGPTGSTVTSTTYRTGYEVQELPRDYRTEVINGDEYYVHDQTYFRPRRDRYVVVEAPRRSQTIGYERPSRLDHGHQVYVERLPPGYRVVRQGSRSYYRSGDTYYERRGTGYAVVDRPY